MIVGIVLLGAACAYGSSFSLFIDVPSLLVVIGCAHAILFGIYGTDAFRILYPKFVFSTPHRGRRIARAGSHLYILAGWIGTGIGWIKMADHLEDLSKFGAAFAVSLLPLLYGYCAHLLVWFPLQDNLGSQLEPIESAENILQPKNSPKSASKQ